MSFSTRIVRASRSNFIGDVAFKMARSAVHGVRRLRNPGIPVDQQYSTVSICDERLSFLHRRTTADLGVLQQCFNDTQYEIPKGPHERFFQALYQRTVDAGLTPLIVDCGANIGASVVWFAKRYPKAHVVAIEPAPDNFALLQRNAEGLNADLRQAGLAAIDGEAHLSNLDEGGWAYRTTEAGLGPAVKMVSLGTVLAAKPASKYVPFLLKIDIEGAENSLFDTDPSTFTSFPLIMIELHDWMLPGQRSSLGFFRLHTAAERELCIKGETVISIAWTPELLDTATGSSVACAHVTN